MIQESLDQQQQQTPKRFKLQTKLDVDDTCSNDAFIFTQQQQRQLKMNQQQSASKILNNGGGSAADRHNSLLK